MIKIEEKISLRNLNTFGVEAVAERFAVIRRETDLDELRRDGAADSIGLILGGGSNVLLLSDIPGLTLLNRLEGIRVEAETGDRVLISAMAGVIWHDLVLWTLRHNYGGLENLSLIPGTAGAAPIQNIGAYGVELKMVFEKLEAFEFKTGKRVTFNAAECRFGYRDSIFKHMDRNRFLITRIWLSLSKKNHQLHLEYGAIRQMLSENGITHPTVQDVSRAVTAIRQSKLPDPEKIGNAGSFFKNPEVTVAEAERLKAAFPELVHYPGADGRIKLSAGWLIEQCGWKGRRVGDAGCYDKQALVLVNWADAVGEDILALSTMIRRDVRAKFGVDLQPEINIV
ncbi:MAG TPA: UDP-N-acetylmuramate dehydrogenase [Flavilitoribacter sp.]|nr:UDP-N-acetylmuramate dehydrogenase [Flavilitoribacter sp.]